MKTVVKAAEMVAKNIGVDIKALKWVPNVGLGLRNHADQDLSLADIQQLFNEQIDFFIRYAYCGDGNSCDRLNGMI